jgi:hypothetical protein
LLQKKLNVRDKRKKQRESVLKKKPKLLLKLRESVLKKKPKPLLKLKLKRPE